MLFFDPRYLIFVGPAILFALFASFLVQSTFAKWKRVRNSSGMTGAEAASVMLSRAGLTDVSIERSSGLLSDHYDPRSRTLRLSPDVYGGQSVASVGVALHEAGHALQHAHHYAPLALRTALVPVAAFGGGYLPWLLIMIGLVMRMPGLALL
ncbi:MAG: zinc metallopeptidase, partial [Candidatus Sumerlaeota bacterium]|nr:zinc metallopeptidase [Candidatus Sumerlaeota bacterium]